MWGKKLVVFIVMASGLSCIHASDIRYLGLAYSPKLKTFVITKPDNADTAIMQGGYGDWKITTYGKDVIRNLRNNSTNSQATIKALGYALSVLQDTDSTDAIAITNTPRDPSSFTTFPPKILWAERFLDFITCGCLKTKGDRQVATINAYEQQLLKALYAKPEDRTFLNLIQLQRNNNDALLRQDCLDLLVCIYNEWCLKDRTD